MKKVYTFIALLFFTFQFSYSQIDTSGGRFWDESLFPNVTITSNVMYGSNTTYNGNTQSLLMDVYEPAGDLAPVRPLIVFAHGGSFIGGSKTDGDVVTLCTRFARMGYVTASIEYRYGMFPIDSVNAIKAVLRATQDMKAAVRWFRQDAAGVNTYRIHPHYLFTGGSSAGAFMALHEAFLDKVSEFPLGATVLNSLGGIEGTSGNPGYPTLPLAMVNLCGALGDSTYLEAGDIPFVSMHGTMDEVVPYGTDVIQVIIFTIMRVDGSASIHERANHVGVTNPFYTWYGANHVPYAGASADAALYMDTTMNFVKTFLRPFMGLPVPTGVNETTVKTNVQIFPNPNNGTFTVIKSNSTESLVAELTDITGRIADVFTLSGGKTIYTNAALPKGIYFLKINAGKETIVRKVLIE